MIKIGMVAALGAGMFASANAAAGGCPGFGWTRSLVISCFLIVWLCKMLHCCMRHEKYAGFSAGYLLLRLCLAAFLWSCLFNAPV